MKKISVLILLTMLLGACTDGPEAESEVKSVTDKEDTTETTVVGKTQEEMNVETIELAVELDFIKANGDEIEDGTVVEATGEITLISLDGIRGGDFTLTTKEGDGYGMYKVINFNTTDHIIEEGQKVTVYGTYSGRDEMNMPQIVATIIE